MAMVNHAGKLVRFTIRPGNVNEAPELPTLLGDVETNELLGDKAFDTNPVRELLAAKNIVATIPPKDNRRVKPHYDVESYRRRHVIENYFADLKQFRGIATRYSKLTERYTALVCLADWYMETKCA